MTHNLLFYTRAAPWLGLLEFLSPLSLLAHRIAHLSVVSAVDFRRRTSFRDLRVWRPRCRRQWGIYASSAFAFSCTCVRVFRYNYGDVRDYERVPNAASNGAPLPKCQLRYQFINSADVINEPAATPRAVA